MSFRPVYKLRSWMPSIQNMDYDTIIKNERSVDELICNDMFSVRHMSCSPAAIEILEKYLEHVDLLELTKNPAAVHLFDRLYESNKFPIVNVRLDDEYNRYMILFEFMNYPHYHNIPLQNPYLFNIFRNPNAMSFIMKHFKHLFSSDYKPPTKMLEYEQKWLLMALCTNPSAIDILLTLDEKFIHFDLLMENPKCHLVLEKYPKMYEHLFDLDVSIHLLCYHNEDTLRFMTKNYKDRIFNPGFRYNLHLNNSDYAIELLMENYDEILWRHLCNNTNPKAIELLRQNKDKIHWSTLSSNEAAIELIEEKIMEGDNINRIHEIFNLQKLALNKGIYVLNTQQMKLNINRKMEHTQMSFVEELTSKVFHPIRVSRHLINYNYNLLSDEYEST